MRRFVEQLQEFSIPLIAGVVAAIAYANFDPEGYHYLVHTPLTEMLSSAEHAESATFEAGHAESPEESHTDSASAHEATGFSHYLTLHFLANDLLMVLFFGIAAKEITEACLPGGKLTPLSKAVNPLFATAGGVLGPIAVYLTLNTLMGSSEWSRGWGIPTATDIALAWLVARMLFGKTHPAVSFLLLLAVADDAIGLGIIAVGYPDPNHPTEWAQVLWLVPGMLAAYGFRIWGVRSWIPYIVVGGAFCWWGLFCAGLHPALALVFVVPFLPGPKHDAGLFVEEVDEDESGDVHYVGHTPLESFEHSVKGVVDWGLFLFAFANAGVMFSAVTGLTWIVLASMVVGKSVGITSCSLLARKLGFPLPAGMNVKDLLVASVVAALGLTVALFVSTQAFAGELQGAAKMGSLLSICAAGLAWALRVGLMKPAPVPSDAERDTISLDDIGQLIDSEVEPATCNSEPQHTEFDRFRTLVDVEG